MAQRPRTLDPCLSLQRNASTSSGLCPLCAVLPLPNLSLMGSKLLPSLVASAPHGF